MKIKVIVPIIRTKNTDLMDGEYQYIQGSLPKGWDVDIEYLDYGSESVESVTEQSFAIPEILKIAGRAQNEGFDGISIDCFADPGVFPVRENVTIPVLGAFMPSMALASTLGENIAILATSDNFRKNLERTVKSSPYSNSIVTMDYLNLTVLELLDRETTIERLVESCRNIVESHKADVIVLGCTVMFYLIDELRSRLDQAGISVQIVEPKRTGLKMLSLLAEMGHTNSMSHLVETNYENIKKRK